jgi:hypothetical protein
VGEDIVAWDGVVKILKKKKNCNQSNTGGVGAKEFLIVLYYKTATVFIGYYA